MALIGGIGSGDNIKSISKFAPDRFRAQFMLGLGYASNNRFSVDLPSIDGMKKPDSGTMDDPFGEMLSSVGGETRNMLCTAANLPGKEIQTTERKIGTETRQVAMGHTLPPIQLTFYLTNTYTMRKYFSNWMFCVSTNRPRGAAFVGYAGDGKKEEYTRDVSVRQSTRNGRRVLTMKMVGCYPVSMSSVELNNQPQTQISELTVQLAYRAYEEDYQH